MADLGVPFGKADVELTGFQKLDGLLAIRRFDDVADADFLERTGDVLPRLAGAVGDQCFDFHARNLATIDPCRGS